MIADQSGATVWRHDNTEPFGDSVPDENPSGFGAFEFPLRFIGTYFDREMNVLHNRPRQRDPAIGRNLEVDPLGVLGLLSASGALGDLDGIPSILVAPGLASYGHLGPAADDVIDWIPRINLYTQVRSNPLSFVDRDGLIATTVVDDDACRPRLPRRRAPGRGNLGRCLDAWASKDASGGKTWIDFCNSLKTAKERAQCFSHRSDSETACRGYCFLEFGKK